MIFILSISSVAFSGCLEPSQKGTNNLEAQTISVVDDLGRIVFVPKDVQKIGLSGSGSARYMVYLESYDRIVGVDTTDNSTRIGKESRPYMLAHPEIATFELLGAKKAQIDPELALKLKPDVIIFSVESAESSKMADAVTNKTGIPVVCYNQYDPAHNFDRFSSNMRLLGKVVGKESRAEEIIEYFGKMRNDLIQRTPLIPTDQKPVVYVGGSANRGAHGLISTKPEFIGFTLLGANHKVEGIGDMDASKISKEKIVEWSPEILFIDLSTLNAAGGGAFVELKTDPSYQTLRAVQSGEIYAVMPDTSCKTNHGTSFANAYFVGTVLYPDQFKDVDPAEKADEIFTFLVGKPVFNEMYQNTGYMGFQKIDLNKI